MEPAQAGTDWTTIGAIITAILGIIATVLQTKGKAAAAAKVEETSAVLKVVVAGVERAGDKSVKGIIKTLAQDEGIQEKVNATVQRIVRGVAPALLLFFGLAFAGCAAPEAGRSQAPAWGQGIQVPIVYVQIMNRPGDAAAPAAGKGAEVPSVSVLITNAGSGTTAPASTASQTATTSVPVTTSIPAGGGLGVPIRLGGAETPPAPVPEPAPPR